MNIVRVSYKRLFPIGSYLNESIGFEADIDWTLGDKPLEVIENLRKIAEQSHREKHPQYYQDNGEIKSESDYIGKLYTSEIQQIPNEKSSKERTIDALIEEMNKCTAISEKNKFGVEVGLISWSDKCLDEPKFREAYDKKLKELQNG